MFAAQNRRPQISCNVGPEISTYHECVSRTSTDLAQLYGALCAGNLDWYILSVLSLKFSIIKTLTESPRATRQLMQIRDIALQTREAAEISSSFNICSTPREDQHANRVLFAGQSASSMRYALQSTS